MKEKPFFFFSVLHPLSTTHKALQPSTCCHVPFSLLFRLMFPITQTTRVSVVEFQFVSGTPWPRRWWAFQPSEWNLSPALWLAEEVLAPIFVSSHQRVGVNPPIKSGGELQRNVRRWFNLFTCCLGNWILPKFLRFWRPGVDFGSAHSSAAPSGRTLWPLSTYSR